MRTLIIVLSFLFMCAVAHAQPFEIIPIEPKTPPLIGCPVTNYTDNEKCISCHRMVQGDNGPEFGLKEVLSDAYYDYPTGRYEFRIFTENGVKKAWYLLTSIESTDIQDIDFYLKSHPDIKTLQIEVYSGGGSIMAAWRIVGWMDKMKAAGYTIETHCYGMALSAGMVVYANGSIGHRYASPTAEFMAHEVMTFKMFDVSTPSKKQDEADVLRHLQDNIVDWLASRAKNITSQELADEVQRLEYWINGTDAFRVGFVDHLVQEEIE